jgi:hypothetical protein
MKKDGLSAFFHSQYSAQGLKYRASLLQPIEKPYPRLLLLLAELVESKKIDKREAETLVKAARVGKWERVVYCLSAVFTLEQLEEKLGLSQLRMAKIEK